MFFITSIAFLGLLAMPQAWGQTQVTPYYAGLTNGDILYAQSITLRERSFNNSYLIIDGRDQVLLEDVLYFKNQEGYFVYEPVENSSRRKLMKREFQGPITLYSVTKVVYNGNNNFDPYYGYGGYSGGNFREKTDYYFRKENGPIVNYTYRNLKMALADSPEAMAIVQEVGRTRFIMYSLYVGGGALTLYGALITLTSGGIPPYTWAGIVMLAIPNFLSGRVDSKMEQAMLLYNKEMGY